MRMTRFIKIDSTNRYLIDKEHKDEFEIVIAKEQTDGRGRRGNYWSSTIGGAWFSFCFTCDKLESISKLPLIAGIAIVEELEKIINMSLEIKWPNDIYVQNKKISGILLEINGNYIIVGIGINIYNKIENSLNDKAISLNELQSESTKKIEIEDLVFYITEKYKKMYYNLDKKRWLAILKELNDRNYLKGKSIKAIKNGKAIEGIGLNINDKGILEIKSNIEGIVEIDNVVEFEGGSI